jgi:predicted RNase H-like HicB family nuclease
MANMGQPNSLYLCVTKKILFMEIKKLNFTAVFLEVPEGGFSGYVEEIPGVNTQGETLEEVKINLVEALYLVLETNKILSQKNMQPGIKSYRETLSFA